MFGIEPRVGLTTTSLPVELLTVIQDEDDLQNILEYENELPENTLKAEGNCSSVSKDIQKARRMATENLEKQANKMKNTSDKSHPPAKIGDNITIPIPDVDKAKGDLRNIIGVVLNINDDGFYRIGTKHGVLQKLYCR